MKPVYETHYDSLKLLKRGKVRDVYDLGNALLVVATDRVSAFDCVFPDPIPLKGLVLTQISRFWFENTKGIVPNHIISFKVEDFPPETRPYAEELRGRAMLVKKARPLPVECVVRGYLHGSATKEYRKTGKVCGITLPEGLEEKSKFSEPIFTPSTKAEVGHDENICYTDVVRLVGGETAAFIRDTSLALYRRGHEMLLSHGVVLVDTKFEFGILDGKVILIDECMTPDSSRLYVSDSYRPGVKSDNFDKQFLRDYLETTGWDKTPPAPNLPADIIEGTSERYLQAHKIITGKELEI